MPGFSSSDAIVNALTAGQTFKSNWSKQFNPTTAAATGEVHTLFRGAGNPGADAIFNAGTALLFQGVTDQTASAGAMQHGGNVQPTFYKSLAAASAVTSGATTVPGWLVLVDVVGFYRLTAVTTVTAQATTNTLGFGDTFTADATTDICTYTSTANIPSNILTGTRVQLTTTTTLPVGLSLATNYFVIQLSDTTFKLATTYANAVAGTAIDITTAGVGTHTISRLYPRYTNGAGVQAIFFNSNATPLGAATPNLSLGYTNSAQVASRATPTVLPVGKTAASNSLVLYSGASGAGKYNYTTPLQAGDAGIAEVNTIQNSTSYVSGEYSVAMVKELARIPLNVLGQAAERNLQFDYPSLPRIYDGAALYWVYMSSTTTPANTTFSGDLTMIWN
jgi:hypothetical protein